MNEERRLRQDRIRLEKEKYQKNVNYIIKNRNPDILHRYIGSTTDVKSRIRNHRYSSTFKTSKLYRTIRELGGWDNWMLVVYEKYPCDNRLEAIKREEELRLLIGCDLNSNICYKSADLYLCSVDGCDKLRQFKTLDRCSAHSDMLYTCEYCGSDVKSLFYHHKRVKCLNARRLREEEGGMISSI